MFLASARAVRVCCAASDMAYRERFWLKAGTMGNQPWRTLTAALLLIAGVCRAETGNGFSLPREDEAFTTGLEDFNRYRDKKQWEAAFRAISKVLESPLKGFVGGDDGVWLPSRQRIAVALRTLPADGLAAYRLFFDAKAKQLFDQANTAGVDDLPPLRTIATQFFLTSDGPAAVDRLGDAEFEAGDFSSAAADWQRLLDDAPDAPAARLIAKRATALARLGRWGEVAAVTRAVAAKYPDETVTFGGRTLPLADYLTSLRPAVASTAPASVSTTAPADASPGLPGGDSEAWQCAFLNDDTADEFKNALQNTGWYRFMDSPDTAVPPSAVDDKHAYVNWLGLVFAIDLKSGKLLWRTDKFSVFKGQGMMLIERGGADPSSNALSTGGGHVFAVGAPPATAVRGGMVTTIILRALDPANGRQQWTSTAGTLGAYSFIGAPLLTGNTLYAVASKQREASLELLAIEPNKGVLQAAIPLGTAAGNSDFRGQTKYPSPLLRAVDGTIYVLTNDGALLAVDPTAKALRWALRTEGPEIVNRENMVFFADDGPTTKVEPPGELIESGGLLYLKETATKSLYALDPAVPKLLWKRPLEKEESVVGLRDGRLITTGVAAEAIDPATHALLWSTTLTAKTGAMRPVFAGRRMVVNTARGLAVIDTDTGDLVKIIRGADRDSVGGNLLVSGDKLICVTNRAVTAYPLTETGP